MPCLTKAALDELAPGTADPPQPASIAADVQKITGKTLSFETFIRPFRKCTSG